MAQKKRKPRKNRAAWPANKWIRGKAFRISKRGGKVVMEVKR